MTEREKILARIREALRVPAPPPGAHGPAATAADHRAPPVAQRRQWLPPAGETPAERLALFQRNATDLKAEFIAAATRADAERALADLRDREGWRKIGSHQGVLTDWACAAIGLPVCRVDGGYDAAELGSCGVGITECDALVAQTGSVLVTARSAGGRALSALPPHHVVLARRDQLVGDLADALELLKAKYRDDYPSFISFITGPSRTGDIERILVLGAHGPKKLTIVCL